MKQVNLKELNIEELSCTFWITLTDDLVERIRGAVAPDEDGDYVFMDSYKIGNVSHFMGAAVSKSLGEGRYKVRVVCEKEAGVKLPKDTISVRKLLEIISSIKEEVGAFCMLRLSFGKRRRPKTIISLPVKISDMPKTVYDEIRGFHFMKREDKVFKYDVILDIEPDGNLMEMINYRKMINIKESILEDVIQEGMVISDCFVIREKQ